MVMVDVDLVLVVIMGMMVIMAIMVIMVMTKMMMMMVMDVDLVVNAIFSKKREGSHCQLLKMHRGGLFDFGEGCHGFDGEEGHQEQRDV